MIRAPSPFRVRSVCFVVSEVCWVRRDESTPPHMSVLNVLYEVQAQPSLAWLKAAPLQRVSSSPAPVQHVSFEDVGIMTQERDAF